MSLPANLPLSVVLITYNEADRIGPTLAAVRGVSDLLVVDSQSTDGTQEVCAGYGARVLSRPFAGFGAQKEFALRQALHEWVLLLDADEVPDDRLLESITYLFASGEPPLQGYFLPRSLVFLGRHFRYGREHAQPQLRLIDRRKGYVTPVPVHEQVRVSGATGILSGELLHTSYRNLADYLQKFNRYTSLAAEEIVHRGGGRSPLATALTFPAYFLKHYLLYGNWRNGYPGFVWSALSAFYPVVKYTKVREFRLLERKSTPQT